MYAGPGAVVLVDQLDYEVSTNYELTMRATDILTGSVADTVVHIAVEVQEFLAFCVLWMTFDW